jgi:hypothetical protein
VLYLILAETPQSSAIMPILERGKMKLGEFQLALLESGSWE